MIRPHSHTQPSAVTRADIRARLAEVATPPKPIRPYEPFAPSNRDAAWGVAFALVLFAFGTAMWEVMHAEYPTYSALCWLIVCGMVCACIWADFPDKNTDQFPTEAPPPCD